MRMTLEHSRMASEVAVALLRRPSELPRYLRQGLRDSRSATDMELPWLSFGAIELLEHRLTGMETVYEFGGGGSTLFFARRAKQVVTVENSPEWFEGLTSALADRELTNVKLILAGADFTDPASFATSDFATALPAEPADIILIDSYDYDPPHPLRPILFEAAQSRIKPGGMIVIDDSWRYKALRTTSRAVSVRTEAGLGPARKSVTSTDFFMY